MRPAEDERLVSQKDVSFGLDHPLRDATVQVGVSGLAVPQGGWDTATLGIHQQETDRDR
jgi:hypothetical protein